ncbi:MAG: glycosyltransferase family 9 protein [Rhodospirillaceae bacterium]|jgi:ADP-heptose:LPS heptosyltransferase|nr:glycosyltransferase family 9 protein [Rhodospirillaceae bacterium]MBT4941010.1 glycosyltransferase family 9 protein [Rhodospirillaceae bacterium]
MSADESPNSILVYVGLDRVGDSLLKLPFVRGLRQAYPDAHITWLAGKDTSVYASIMAPVVNGLIDEVIEHPGAVDGKRGGIGLSPKELLRRPLGGQAFDLVIDTQKVAIATLILFRIRHKKFVSPFGNFILSSKKPPKDYKFPKLMQRQMLDLLEITTGQSFPTPFQLEIDLDPILIEAARAALPDGPSYIGLSPGAGGLPKCWPLEKFIELARQQVSLGRQPVFILGPQELDWHKEIAAAVPEALFPLQDKGLGAVHKFAPALTMALAQRLALAVSNDSGTGHMFATGGAKLISLFGRTVPEKFTPMAASLTIIRAQDYGGREMHFIPVETVAEAIEAVLAG